MRIYFYCFDNNKPVGGIRQIYRQVDILNGLGYKACVLHDTQGFRCSWFENSTEIEYTPSVNLSQSDILVAPELVGPAFTNTAKGVRKVIFNQNCYFTFNAYSLDKNDLQNPYHHEDLLGVITVSEDSRRYLRYVFPNIPIYRIKYGLDRDLFSHNANKSQIISFMPRKNPHAVTQVVNMLKFRGALGDFELRPIDSLTQSQVARVMKESMIFLSFGFPEGFGLPAAEAMACGCVVIGFHGGGGREFFLPEFSYPIEQEDIVGYARTVEQVISLFDTDPDRMRRMSSAAADFVLREYSRESEVEATAHTWDKITSAM